MLLQQEIDTLAAHISEVVDLVATFKSNRLSLTSTTTTPSPNSTSNSAYQINDKIALAELIPLKFQAIETQLELIKLEIEEGDVVDGDNGFGNGVERSRIVKRYQGLLEEFKL